MKQPIQTIVFDMGGVLIDYSLSVCIDSFHRLGWKVAEELINPFTQGGILLDLERGAIDPPTFRQAICQAIGHPVADEKIDQALCSFLIALPLDKLDMLRALRRQGFQLFMLSNTNPIMMHHIRNTFFRQQGGSVDDYFDRLFLSFEMKQVKPGDAIFRQMIETSQILPSETLFIDDGEANIQTAQTLGFHTYLASQHEDLRPLFDYYTPLAPKNR
ncbi:MAG: HAD family phosphatase [Alistipes sp.]|nr:HAD family phosphatase [Alistipes sp.]